MFLKDRDAVLDYRLDWRAACADGAAITASLWSVEPAHDGAISVSDMEIVDGWTSAMLGGGVAGCVYRVGNRVTLSDGRVDERSLVVRVEER